MAKKRQPNLSAVIKQLQDQNQGKRVVDLEDRVSGIEDIISSILDSTKNTFSERRQFDIAEKEAGGSADDARIPAILGRMTDLEKDMKSLENTVLAVTELVNRMPIKESASTIKDEEYDLDPDLPLGEYYKNVLMKIYSFMTKNAEKEKKEIDSKKGLKKEKQQERERKYEKVEKDLGLKKKKGFFGKVGSILKGTFWVGLATAITGLVYLFRDEIKEFAKETLKSLVSYGDKIVSVINVIKSIYEGIMDFISPVINMVKNSPIFKSLSDKSTSLSEGVQGTIKEVVDWVTSQISSVIDGISTFISEQLPSLIGNSLKSLMGFIMAEASKNGGVAGMVVGALGPWWMKGLSAIFGIQAAVTSLSGFAKTLRYGEGYQDTLKDIVGQMPEKTAAQQDIKKRFQSEDYLQDVMDHPEKLDEVLAKTPEEGDKEYQDRVNSQLVKILELRKQQMNHIEEKLVGTGYTFDKDAYMNKVGQMKSEKDKLSVDVTDYIKRPDGSKISGHAEFYDLMLPRHIAQQIEEPAKNFLKEKGVELSNYAKGKLTKFGETVTSSETFKKLEDAKEKAEEKVEEAEESASKIPTQVSAKAKETYSSLRGATVQGVAEKLKPIQEEAIKKAEKIETLDFMADAEKYYDMFQKGLKKVVDKAEDPATIDKIRLKIESLTTIERKTEVKEDPNSDPTTVMESTWNKAVQSMTVNSVKNNVSKNEKGIVDYSSIPVRDKDWSLQVANYMSNNPMKVRW